MDESVKKGINGARPSGPEPPTGPVRLAINWRLLLITLMTIGVLGLASFFRHRTVVHETAESFLVKAEQMEGDGKWMEAALAQQEYLRFHPHAVDIWYRLAINFGKGAESPLQKMRGVEIYFRALGQLPSTATAQRGEIQRKLADALLEQGRWSEAEELARELGDEPARWRVEALAQYAKAQTTPLDAEAKQTLFASMQKALKVMPGDQLLAEAAAHFCRNDLETPDEQQRAELANKIIDTMLSTPENQQNALAWAIRSRYRVAFGEPGSDEDLRRALELDGDDPDILIAAGADALRRAVASTASPSERQRLLAEAEAHCARAIELAPLRPDCYLGIADTLLQQGKTSSAIEQIRAGLQKVGGRDLDLQGRLVDILLTQADIERVRPEIASFDETARQVIQRAPITTTRDELLGIQGRVDLARARLLLAEHKDRDALRLLESMTAAQRSVAMSARGERDQLQTWGLLAAVRGRLQMWRAAAEAYERLCDLAPNVAEYHLQAAEAWKNGGGVAKMEFHLERAAACSDSSDGLFALAEIQLRRQSALPPESRQWREFDELLDRIRTKNPGSWRVQLLASAKSFADGSAAERQRGLTLLGEAEKMAPDDATLWERLTITYQQLGQVADADRALAAYRRIVGPGAAGAVLHARLLASRRQLHEAQNVLDAALPLASPAQQQDLLRQAANIHLQAGDIDAAHRQLIALHQLAPADTTVISQILDLYLQRNQFSEMPVWEEKLSALEGAEGTGWRYYRARRLVSQAKQLQSPELAEAKRLQQEIVQRDAENTSAAVLQGDLSARQSLWDDAIENYRRAIALGDQRVSTYEKLVSLLYRLRRFGEADAVLNRLKQNVGRSQLLSALAISVGEQVSDIHGAVARARNIARLRSGDLMAQIWLAQALMADNEVAEAETLLKQVVVKWPRDVTSWTSLFAFYLVTDRREQARDTLRDFEQRTEIPAVERSTILAQSFQRMGDMDSAVRHFQAAIAAQPSDPQLKLQLAAVLTAHDPAAAETQLRTLIQASPDFAPARRMLAMLLSQRGGSQSWEEIEQLISAGPAEDADQDSAVDQRLKAILLARRGNRQDWDKARSLLEKLQNHPQGLPADRLLLAKVYQSLGDRDKARQQYAAVADSPTTTPEQLTEYAGFLLDIGDDPGADKVIARLQQMVATASLPVQLSAIELKGRHLARTESAAQASSWFEERLDPLLKKANNETDRLRVMIAGAQFHRRLNNYTEAARWLRQLVPLRHAYYPALAEVLAKMGNHREAVDLVLQQKSAPATETVPVLTTVLSIGTVPADVQAAAEPFLSKAIEEHRSNPDVLIAVASLKSIQMDAKGAVEMFEEANRLRPGDLGILNNLATVMAEDPHTCTGALERIEEAIRIGGELPELLDTKGTILARLGQSEAAVKVLQQAADGLAQPDPRSLLHLAVALQQLGRDGEARDVLTRAMNDHVDTLPLTRTDRQELLQLQQELKIGT